MMTYLLSVTPPFLCSFVLFSHPCCPLSLGKLSVIFKVTAAVFPRVLQGGVAQAILITREPRGSC